MKDINIEDLGETGGSAILCGEELIGFVEGCDLTIQFGSDLDDGIDDEVSLAATSTDLARGAAVELSRIGRSEEYRHVPELSREEGERFNLYETSDLPAFAVHAEMSGGTVYGKIANEPTAWLILRTLAAYARSLPRRFCPVSLGDFLELCASAGVPHVPAENVAEIRRYDWMRFDTLGAHRNRLVAVFEAVHQAAEPQTMMRWDFCASLDLKSRMASGLIDWVPGANDLILDDPCAIDIISEISRDHIPVWKRPWIPAVVSGGWPVEYRCFVRDGRIAGISSYYPQRPLPEFPEHLRVVREYTEKLIA